MWCFYLLSFLTSSWGYQGFDFSKRQDLKSLRAQNIHTGMVGRLSGRIMLRFYVGKTTEDAQKWILKMIDHYGIYTPVLDEELTLKYGYDIYVAQGRIYFTYRDNVGYCVDAYKDQAAEALDILLSLQDILVEGDVKHSVVPSIVRRASVDQNGDVLETSHFHIELTTGIRMLYRGGILDEKATTVGRSKNPEYVAFQKLPSHIYLFDQYGYGSIFAHDSINGFTSIGDGEVNQRDLPRKNGVEKER